MKFQKLEDDQTLKDQQNLKQKKELLKQEFEHLEEIKKYDNLSIVSSNDFKFKAELDKLLEMNRSKNKELSLLLKPQTFQPSKSQMGGSQMQTISGTYGQIRSINNHHSDPLFVTFTQSIYTKDTDSNEQYIEQLKVQEERYNDLILEESEKRDSLEQQLIQIEKSKLILQQKVEQYQMLTRMSNKRFSNTQSLQFLAEQKKETSKVNLRSIKDEFEQMKKMQDTYKKQQKEKQSNLQKVIYVGEENIGHNAIKIEHALQMNTECVRQIEKLEIEKQKKIEKKLESRYILTYIECFENFERIFMQPTGVQNAYRLVDEFQVDEEQLRKYSQQQIQFDQSANVQSEEDFDRNELLSQITKFYQQGENRTKYILNFMLEQYWHLQSTLNKSSLEYENLLKQKKVLLDVIENLEWEINELKQKNPNLEVHEYSSVAEDAGLLEVKEQMTTLNIKKMEMEDHSDNVLYQKAAKAQGLLMKFQLGLAEFVHRVFQIISLIDNKNKEIKKFKYTGLSSEILNFEKYLAKVYHSNEKKFQITNNSEQMDVQPLHLNLFQISNIISQILNINQNIVEEISSYFFIQCKTDQILWFHLTQDNFTQFISQFKSFDSILIQKELQSPKVINQFREQLIDIFTNNFKELFTFFTNMYSKVKDIAEDLLIHLKENNPKFDFNKLNRNLAKEGQDIKQAKQLIIKRMIEYKTGDNYSLRKENSMQALKNTKTKIEDDQVIEQVQTKLQQDYQNSKDLFPLKEEFDESQLTQIKSFFRQKIKEKNEEKKECKTDQNSTKDQITIIKDQQDFQQKKKIQEKNENKYDKGRNKKNQEIKPQKQVIRDELEQERELMKAQIASNVQKMQEEKERKEKPEFKEQQNERKTQIKESTERLYGERGYTVQLIRNMALTSNILSDIDQLEHFQTKIEQPQLVSTFVMQRKNLHKNLTKDLTLPQLSYLKPTSAYIARRNQSSEQIKAMDYKRYYEIENGVSIRPQTQQLARKSISKQKTNTFNTEEYKKKYSEKNLKNYNSDIKSNQMPQPIAEFPTNNGPQSCLIPQMY
ncbi:unnamed protein product [Paramecium pentaurelia]|uniref:Uncharacterized protein n=1 Tax=Paramecium pentaurelia TaxID=43138 RepID=A0A8S1T9P9_9CILI|nr:unnamed protein product [Paramecium pentaurelia]